MNDLLSIDQVAAKFGKHPATIRTWVRKKKLAVVRMSKRSVFFRESDILKAINERTVNAL